MEYTVILKDKSVFYTNWFDADNNWNDDCHFMVINNYTLCYTTNGYDWKDIEEDHL